MGEVSWYTILIMIKEKSSLSRSKSLLAILKIQMFHSEHTTFFAPGIMDQETMNLLQLYLEDERLAKVLANNDNGPDKLIIKKEDLESATKCTAQLAIRNLPITMVSTD